MIKTVVLESSYYGADKEFEFEQQKKLNKLD